MFNHIFNSQTKTITFAAILLGGSALISRALGLVRDRLLAGTFGAGEELDVYFAAFRIPDFVFGMVVMGGISAVFLPVFSQYFLKDEKEGWRLASNVINCFLVLLIVVCGLLAVFTPWLIKFITPGFSSEQKDLAVSLTRIMFLSPVFFGLSSVFSGILHYFNRFLAYALVPILYNLGIIFGILFLYPVFGLLGLVYGVILGAFFHLFVQIPAAKSSGFRYLPLLNFNSEGLRRIFKLMIPRTVGAAAYHINLIVITAIASTLTVGSIAIFTFSNNLQHFPIGIIGASFAIASFPTLSRAWVNGRKEIFISQFSSTFRQVLFLIIPVSILTFLLRAQLVRLILGTGQFDWSDTRLTAASLGLFCLGIFAAALVPFLARVFYSFQNTKTPVAIGVVSMALNIILCFLFVGLLNFDNVFQSFLVNSLKLQGIQNIGVVGLPLALSVSGVFQFSLLLIFLRKRMGHIRLKEIRNSFGKIVISSILMGISVYLVLRAIAVFICPKTFGALFFQTLLASLFGIFVYLLACRLLKSPEFKTLKSSIFKQFTK